MKGHDMTAETPKLDRIVAAIEKLADSTGDHPHKMVVEHSTTPAAEKPADDYTKRLMALDKAVYRGGQTTDEVLATARAFYGFLSGAPAPSIALVKE